MMKVVGTTLVLLGFVGMAGFGFLAMNPQGDMQGCIAALTRGGECPAESDSVASLTFHAGVIKSFSMATVSTGFLVAFMLFVILAVAFLQKGTDGAAAPFIAAHSRYKREVLIFASPLKQRVLRWFSLHENSPAVL